MKGSKKIWNNNIRGHNYSISATNDYTSCSTGVCLILGYVLEFVSYLDSYLIHFVPFSHYISQYLI